MSASTAAISPRMPLPRVLRPYPGEAFASFIDRNARFQNVHLVSLLHRVGLSDAEQVKAVPNGYGVHIEPRRKEIVAGALRLSAAEINGLLLEGFDGIAFDAVRSEKGAFDSLGTRLSSWIYMSGSHVCPECIQGSDSYWRAAWKLPWSFACVEHARLLASECPNCEVRFAAWRRDRQVKPAYGFVVPEVGKCLNVLGGGTRGHRTGACNYDITTVDTLCLSKSSPVLAAQEWVDSVITSRQAVIAGERVPAIEFFRILRGLSSLMLYAATRSEIAQLVPDLPMELMDLFEEFELAREKRLEAARREAATAIATGQREKPGSLKETAFAPTDPRIMAVLVTASKVILDAADPSGVADRARPLLAIAKERGGGSGASLLVRLGLPEVFTQLYSIAFKPPRDHRYSRTRLALGGDASYSFEARHVPSVYWEPEFHESFAGFFKGADVSDLVARQAVSLLMAELVVGGARDAALEAIGITLDQGMSGVRRAAGILRSHPKYEPFVEALHDEARRLSGEYELVDYTDRRTRFAEFATVPPQDWAFIAGHAGIGVGHEGGRSRMAAAWVWTKLTQADYRHAPALTARVGSEENAREVYRAFVKSMSDDLLKVLWGYVGYLGRGGRPGAFGRHALNQGFSVVNGVFGYGFDLRHVPQLFWQDAYEETFRPYFRALGVADKTGRAATSVMLAELVVSMTRADLGNALGLDKRRVQGGVSAAIQRVRASENATNLQNELREFALDLSEDPRKVDFHAMRAALTDFNDIPELAWAEICSAAGVGEGRAGVRSKQAAAWLWAELLQADARTSPAFADLRAASNHATVVYDKFVRKFVPEMKLEILRYAIKLSQAHSHSHHTVLLE